MFDIFLYCFVGLDWNVFLCQILHVCWICAVFTCAQKVCVAPGCHDFAWRLWEAFSTGSTFATCHGMVWLMLNDSVYKWGINSWNIYRLAVWWCLYLKRTTCLSSTHQHYYVYILQYKMIQDEMWFDHQIQITWGVAAVRRSGPSFSWPPNGAANSWSAAFEDGGRKHLAVGTAAIFEVKDFLFLTVSFVQMIIYIHLLWIYVN